MSKLVISGQTILSKKYINKYIELYIYIYICLSSFHGERQLICLETFLLNFQRTKWLFMRGVKILKKSKKPRLNGLRLIQ